MAKELSSIVQFKDINWSALDNHKEAINYTLLNGSVNIYRHLSYVFIGPPVRMIFPHIQILNELVMPGVYFTGNNFIEVTMNGSEYDAEIINYDIKGISEVQYCVSFIPAFNFKNQKYFGSSLCRNSKYTMYNRPIRMIEREPNSSNYSWLADLVNLRNEDDSEEFHVSSRSKNSQVKSINQTFFDGVDRSISEEIEVLVNLIRGDKVCDFTLRIITGYMSSLSSKGKGKGAYNLPTGITKDLIEEHRTYSLNSTSSGSKGDSKPSHPLVSMADSDLVIIQGITIHLWKNGSLNVVNFDKGTEEAESHLRNLTVAQSVISNKIREVKQIVKDLKEEEKQRGDSKSDKEPKSKKEKEKKGRKHREVLSSSSSSEELEEKRRTKHKKGDSESSSEEDSDDSRKKYDKKSTKSKQKETEKEKKKEKEKAKKEKKEKKEKK